MSKLLKTAVVALAAAPVAAFSLATASADSPGQLTGGSNVFVVKNVTKGGSYAGSASATCNEELRYSIRLHNAAYGGLTNIQVKVDLDNGKVTAVPAEGASQGTSGSVSVNIANGSLVYENGSTQLYDANGNVIKTLPDTITTSGVNIGDIKGSTTEFVNFNAKVNCPEKPPVTPPETPPTPPVTPQVKGQVTQLPNTGAGDVLAIFAGASSAGAAAHYAVRRFRK